MPQVELVVRMIAQQEVRQCEDVFRPMIDGDSELRAVLTDGLRCAAERVEFRAFDVHLEERRADACEDVVERVDGHDGLARIADARLLAAFRSEMEFRFLAPRAFRHDRDVRTAIHARADFLLVRWIRLEAENLLVTALCPVDEEARRLAIVTADVDEDFVRVMRERRQVEIDGRVDRLLDPSPDIDDAGFRNAEREELCLHLAVIRARGDDDRRARMILYGFRREHWLPQERRFLFFLCAVEEARNLRRPELRNHPPVIARAEQPEFLRAKDTVVQIPPPE